MSDIDVSFSTNAGAVAGQIDGAANSTRRASDEAKRHAQALRAEEIELKKAAQAARAKAREDRMLANESRRINDEYLRREAANAAAAGRASKNRLGKGLGSLGLGQAFGQGAAMAGPGAGIGGILAATGAMAGVGLAIGLLAGVVEKWLNKAEEQAKVTEALTKAFDDQLAASGSRGISAAMEFGPAIRMLTSQGGTGLGVAQSLSKQGFGGDAYGASVEARKLFGGSANDALKTAAEISRLTGESLPKLVKMLDGTSRSKLGTDAGARGLYGQVMGGKGIGFDEARRNVAGSEKVKQIDAIQTAVGATQVAGLGDLTNGVIKSQADLVEATNGLNESIRAVLTENRKLEAIRAQDQSRQKAVDNAAVFGLLYGPLAGAGAFIFGDR